ncbi:acyl-CoA ligase (AMP-forming), exosortase A-associated [Actinokineospora alba]|uniref:Acyl-CoA ligase (AMP-forming), exosortase A-associated n=1 Tax=Actinokineospora alba TaxID=504798 RepID=A0A1H0QYS9_9PSEU|nr:acyl-CoA ligase (AMP-forming), exosortase A system-associated [Actinokineospora alba]TDP70350.1 acyl-CoA ligase (AMP-forming) (exosortase A-associated) [Actinokineospora alba]SDI33553.1 acyl-CoA ligase (AMP-forming), exosortase A-associated [Actinokineospora alba]SDP21926.1 acyl-CoA ligase (AMP-forming), exosortase A-associated [Actinokineospora alba]
MPTRLDDLLRCGDTDHPAVTFKDETVTYGELRARVDGVAGGLRRRGLRRGERVVVYLDKRIETVVALFAVSAAGGVVVPVNPVFKSAQVGYIVADCAAAVLITTPERHRTLLAEGLDTASLREVVLVGELDDNDPTATAWADLDGPAEAPVGVIDADVAAILYTSGSTGGPKGVVLSHRNLLAGAASVADYLGHTADDVVLSVLPLSFDAGFSQLTTAFIAGAHVVLVNYLLPREVVRLCARHGVTALTCVPPLWIQLTALPWPPESTHALRYFANTGGRMPRATLDRLREIFPDAHPYLMYGLTEAFRSTYLDPAEVDRRPDSIGRAIPNAEILVVRPDGTECDPGEHGEIVHRGALVALGYWNDPRRTAERFRPCPTGGASNPGLHSTEIAVWSGDTAYRDEDGFLYFVGRTDDMIKTSGYRVSPTEIEEAAYATGLVGEAVAFGVPDERLGQHVVLVVGGGSCDTETLLKSLEKDLPKYMLPRRVEVLGELPRSGNGKFDRNELRRRLSS